MTTINILIVDDDHNICTILKTMLEKAGYYCSCVHSAKEAYEEILHQFWDLVVLDVMLPESDGFEICRDLRKTHQMPVLFLTARNNHQDMQSGYLSGADDYLTKPFTEQTLLWKVHALLRRYLVYEGKQTPEPTSNHPSSVQSLANHLTDIEYRILHFLASHVEECCSIQTIYEAVWEEAYWETSRNTVMVHICGLRKKIEAFPLLPYQIRTIWGKGYQLEHVKKYYSKLHPS
ncbi:response regulator transcription factor [Tindallia californiensis]|uniref:Stage 0 sporulation protein A homolog n=1 Tax=Tindallia californiensis TaxID=159292 RepID=A0A1H3QDX9_9FIRM|nr:response regulator transcription factor [Tindallia californiensis]SDZ11473.1 DNA-binding response regulator, OmpR family, contains REC and winged-helix (wHTH) domain [Tindallia californiensis]